MARSPRADSRDRLSDWIGADQSMSMVVGASNRPARAPWTMAARAAVTWRVCSRIARGEVYRHACASSGVGSRNAAHTAGMVVGASARDPAAWPVTSASTARRASSSAGVVSQPWAPIRARSSTSQRAKMSWVRCCCTWLVRLSHRSARGPGSRGLIRVGSPTPSVNGCTPTARHSGSYSSLTSPATRVRTPKCMSRNRIALTMVDLPVPGLPKKHQVRVGGDLGQHPGHRVDAEPGPGAGVHPEGGAGRRQRVPADEREDRPDLGCGGPVGDQRVRHGGPPAQRPTRAPGGGDGARQPRFGGPCRTAPPGRRGGGQPERVGGGDVGQGRPGAAATGPSGRHGRSPGGVSAAAGRGRGRAVCGSCRGGRGVGAVGAPLGEGSPYLPRPGAHPGQVAQGDGLVGGDGQGEPGEAVLGGGEAFPVQVRGGVLPVQDQFVTTAAHGVVLLVVLDELFAAEVAGEVAAYPRGQVDERPGGEPVLVAHRGPELGPGGGGLGGGDRDGSGSPLRGHVRVSLSVRPIPSGRAAVMNPVSWARSRRSSV